MVLHSDNQRDGCSNYMYNVNINNMYIIGMVN